MTWVTGKSRFLVQVYRANPRAKVEVKAQKDVDVQAEVQDWLLAKARKSATNIFVKVKPVVDDIPADVDRVPFKAPTVQDIHDGKIPSSGTTGGQAAQAKA